ncbi:MAG: permease [Spirochaetales bacterium]|nr:permease [Spirochaetales bacterium]
MKKNIDKKKEVLRDIVIFTVLFLISILLMISFPEKQQNMIRNTRDFLLEMVFILPAVMVLMGLFAVWVPKQVIEKYLGKTSGIKGMLFSFILGALPTGPLYVAFPLASGLHKKGASILNIVIFLSAWACIKIPQELVEIQFLGVKFMLARLLLTIIFVTIMAIIINKIMIKPGKPKGETGNESI